MRAMAVTICIFVLGCDDITGESRAWREEVRQTRETLQKEIEETREMARQAAETAVRAVPGERYLQLIDALNGTDQDKRREAQAFLRSLGQLDPQDVYEASVWFGFDTSKPLKVDVFRGPSPDRSHVVQYVARHSLNLTDAKNSLASPLADTDVREAIETELSAMIDLMSGTEHLVTKTERDLNRPPGNPLSGTGFSGEFRYTNSALFPSISQSKFFSPSSRPRRTFEWTKNAAAQAKTEFEALVEGARARRRQIVSHLTNALNAPYSTVIADGGELEPSTLRIPWPHLDAQQYLFVVMPKSDWEAQRDGLEVRALVHKAGEPSSGIRNSRAYPFSTSEFDPAFHETVPQLVPGQEELVWAVHNMTDSNLFNRATLESVSKLESLLQQWDERDAGTAE